MDNDTNDIISHLDGNLLLPPRKRLLPGMRRQNLEMNLSNTSSFDCNGSEFEARMNNLVKSHLSSNPNLSNDEIVEAARSAAIEKSKVAKSARAAAEEKAAKAAMAVAAARSALELVASVNEETDDDQDKYLKKNKMQKHVAIQSLYGKYNGVYSCKTDEELARKLHEVINRNCSRISKTIESGDPINKRAKVNVDFDGCVTEELAVVDLNGNKKPSFDLSNIESRETEKSLMIHKEDNENIDKKKLRIKQKMLPLSICNVKDLEIPSKSLFCVGASSESIVQVEKNAKMWKCKGFKVPSCVKQNKVMQS